MLSRHPLLQYLAGKDEGRDEADKGREVGTETTDDHHDNGERQITLGLGDHGGCLDSCRRWLGDHHNILHEVGQMKQGRTARVCNTTDSNTRPE